MEEFMLLVRNEIDHQASWSPEQHHLFLEECEEYIDTLRKAGKLLSAQPLVREGTIISGTRGAWQSGPFDESREVIVGYYHILAEDVFEAVTIAEGNPEFAHGTTARIEIRPIMARDEALYELIQQ